MTPLSALWLPILISAVVVFFVSSLIHMVTPWHKSDYGSLPNEQSLRDAMRPLAIPPGDYHFPRPSSMADMKSPEFQQKMTEGPVAMMTVLPNGSAGMGRALGLWFVHLVIVGVFAAYITGRALPPGANYLHVFRFAGCTAFIAYSFAIWPMWIWYRRSLVTTIKSTIDGLIFGLLTAGVFGWLWPR